MLTHPRLIWAASLLAIVLCLPALDVGLLMDDYAHRMIMLRVPGTPVEPLSVFANFYGEPEANRQFMDQGIVPWWTVPDFRLAFSRVLSAISMWIDYRLWPESPALMHAHSLLWLGAMVAAAGLAYRRLWGRGSVAGLAVLLFALDDAHAMPAAWIANRNALIATALGLLAVAAHERWRREGWKWGAIASAGCLALALLSGEAAVGAVGYLGAWAFTMEDGWRRRIGSLVPAAVVDAAVGRVLPDGQPGRARVGALSRSRRRTAHLRRGGAAARAAPDHGPVVAGPFGGVDAGDGGAGARASTCSPGWSWWWSRW